MSSDEALLDVAQVATMLGVCKQTVLRYIKSGQLDYYRLSPRSIRFTAKQVSDFINTKQGN